jgi:hypothetical protein
MAGEGASTLVDQVRGRVLADYTENALSHRPSVADYDPCHGRIWARQRYSIEFRGCGSSICCALAKSQALTARAAMGLLQLQMPGARDD